MSDLSDLSRTARRLTRFSFVDPARAGELLTGEPLRWWDPDENGPVDERAAAVVAALGRSADPDGALAALAAIAATPDGAGVRDALCESAAGAGPAGAAAGRVQRAGRTPGGPRRGLAGRGRGVRRGRHGGSPGAVGRRRSGRPGYGHCRRPGHRHRHRRGDRAAGRVPPRTRRDRRPRPGRRDGPARGHRGARRPGRSHPAGGALGRRHRPGRAGGAVPAGDRRDGQGGRARTQLRQRRRRGLRRRAGRPSRPGGRRRPGAGQRDLPRRLRDADLPGRGLGGRRGAAARGQGRPAGPDPGQPRGVLQAVGEHLGVPGPAQGPAGRRRSRSGPVLRRDHGADGVECGRAAGLRRRRAGHAPPGRRPRAGRGRRPGDQARPGRAARRRVRGAAAATGARSRRRVAARARHAVGAGRTARRRLHRPRRRVQPRRRISVPAHGRAPAAAAPAAAHPPGAGGCRRTRLAGPHDGLPPGRTRRCPRRAGSRSGRCTPARCAACTRSSSTGRCSRRWRACRPTGCGSRLPRPADASPPWASPTPPARCATSSR